MKMFLKRVSEPPTFTASCLDCIAEGKRWPQILGVKYADLHGTAFESYYCEPHASARIQRGESHA